MNKIGASKIIILGLLWAASLQLVGAQSTRSTEEIQKSPEKPAPKGPAPVVHFEIGCKNLAKTTDFYREIFNWNIKPAGLANNIAAADKGITGHITALGEEPYHYVTVYISVDKILPYSNALSLLPKYSQMLASSVGDLI